MSGAEKKLFGLPQEKLSLLTGGESTVCRASEHFLRPLYLVRKKAGVRLPIKQHQLHN